MNPFVYGLIFAKWFTMVFFVATIYSCPFVQETKSHVTYLIGQDDNLC